MLIATYPARPAANTRRLDLIPAGGHTFCVDALALARRGGRLASGVEDDADDRVPILSLRDGEMIYLRPHREQLPRLAFDDVADVIASGLNDQPGRWAPRHARSVALGAGAAALAAGAVFILRSGPPWRVPAEASAAVRPAFSSFCSTESTVVYASS